MSNKSKTFLPNPQGTSMIYKTYMEWQPADLRDQNYVVTILLSSFRDAVYGQTEINGEMVDTINIPISENEIGVSRKGACWCNMLAVKVDEDAYDESHVLLPIYSNNFYRKIRELGYKNVKLGRMHSSLTHRRRTKSFAKEQNRKLIIYSNNK